MFLALALAVAQTMFAWNKDPDPSVTGYKLHVGTTSGTYSLTVDAGNVTTFPIGPPLVAGTNYFAVVKAYNAQGAESLPSNEVAFTPAPLPPTPTPTPTATPTATPSLTPTPTPAPTPPGSFSLFAATAKPSLTDPNDPAAVELGVNFSSSVPGQISAIKFYKLPANTSAHVANLWVGGVKVASAPFTNETASGWQSVALNPPIKVTAGSGVIASYHTIGHYAANNNGFATQVVSGPLTAKATNNGFYTYGTGSSIPASTYQASNYWVDVVFTPTPIPTPTPATPTPTPTATPKPTYVAWLSQVQAQITAGISPAALTTWLVTHPPTKD